MADICRKIEEEIPRLRRYARALTRDINAADDLVQDCLTRALSKVHLWQKGTDLRAWLFTILHNQYVNHVRRAVREGSAVGLSDSEPMLTSAPNQGKRLELRDLEMLRQLMGMAPERPEPGRAAALRRVAPVQGHSEITFEGTPRRSRSPLVSAESALRRNA